jgi:1,4-alpha-glucan branching enzyme
VTKAPSTGSPPPPVRHTPPWKIHYRKYTFMKHSKHHDQPRGTQPHLETVRFEFTHPTATTVSVAGSFNKWDCQAKPLHRMPDGTWLKETTLPPGTYEYCLVVDGQWMADPRAGGSVPNPYGGRNSLLVVSDPSGASPRAGAEHGSPGSPPPLK